MDDKIIYRPEKFMRIMRFVFLPITMALFLLAGCAIPSDAGALCCMLLAGSVSALVAEAMYDASKKAVVFEEDGVRIIGGSYKEYRYMSWAEVMYACYTYNNKGHEFLVLSPQMLTPEKAHHMVKKISSGLHVVLSLEDVLLIHMDILQDVTPIKNWVAEHVTVLTE